MKKKELNHNVLAEGEKSGHSHRVWDEGGAAVAVLEREDGVRTFHAGPNTKILHEEHGPAVPVVGDCAAAQVIEYDHFAEEARTVRD